LDADSAVALSVLPVVCKSQGHTKRLVVELSLVAEAVHLQGKTRG
jgi:hypothetical protein